MAAAWKFSGQEIFEGFYGTICAFSAVGLLPFLLGNVEKYASAGKTVLAGILTLGGILMGMAVLLPAVLGYGQGCSGEISGAAVAGRSRPAGKCAGQI